MLSSIGAMLLSAGLKFLLDYLAQRRGDANAKALGESTAVATINKGSADAERRAANAAINAPDTGRVLDDMDAGKF